MGLSGISPGSLLIILLIILLFTGTDKIRSLGEDLGAAFKNFKKALNDDDTKTANSQDTDPNTKNNLS